MVSVIFSDHSLKPNTYTRQETVLRLGQDDNRPDDVL